jgi:hypothetical protein
MRAAIEADVVRGLIAGAKLPIASETLAALLNVFDITPDCGLFGLAFNLVCPRISKSSNHPYTCTVIEDVALSIVSLTLLNLLMVHMYNIPWTDFM